MAYARIEQFGFVMENLRAGLMPAVYANANRKANADAVGPLDFFEPRKANGLTPDDIATRMRSMLNAAADKP